MISASNFAASRPVTVASGANVASGSLTPHAASALCHADVQTTMIYTHVLNSVGGRGVRSPLETL
ncbi:MAG TPA: hypothetical protein VNA69_15160 [Thermoanaerobaculia bacterium]|nr:hypothetical protein [Thermoanaerobaculia bacterium]